MKIYVGSDHNGFFMKQAIVDYLKKNKFNVVDDGDNQLDPQDDYPDFAKKVVADVLGSKDKHSMGILLCGSGQGMCMTANRYKGIRAALGYDQESVRSSRNDDDANILCLPARILSEEQACELAKLFIKTEFAKAPRFSRRIQEMDEV